MVISEGGSSGAALRMTAVATNEHRDIQLWPSGLIGELGILALRATSLRRDLSGRWDIRGQNLMKLGQRLPLDRLKLSRDLDVDKSLVSNQTFRRAINVTSRYQRQVSVEGCSELTKDVFPLLQSCVVLRDLNLTATSVTDLLFLQGCKALVNLKLSRTAIKTCDGVEQCLALRYVDLRHTAVVDLGPFSNCKELRYLDIGGTPVEDLEPLGDCRRLTTLYLDGTQVSNIDALAPCQHLELVNIGFTRVDRDLISPDVRMEAVVMKPRSLSWFEAVLRNKVDSLPAILGEAQWIDERANPFLRLLCMSCYEKQCRRKTPFFSLAQDALRPTALHMAVLLGQEVMIHFLMKNGADAMLKCWIGDMPGYPPTGLQGQVVTPGRLADLCGEHVYWGTIREHYKRGLNTRKVCLDKALRIRRILRMDDTLTEELIRAAEEQS